MEAPNLERNATLFWRENGRPSVTPPEHEGFGSQPIQRTMEETLGRAQLDFDPQGLACTGNGLEKRGDGRTELPRLQPVWR